MHPNRGLRASAVFSLALLALSPLFADVTLRYRAETRINGNLQATGIPEETLLQFRNGRGFTASGPSVSICDFTRQEITLLDHDRKRYAVVGFRQMADELEKVMPQLPEQSKAIMAQIKSHVETKATGAAATIQGVEGEEHEIVATVDGPVNPAGGTGPMMRIVMRFWTAKASEILRVPAIREVAGYNLASAATMNPLAAVERIFRQMPASDMVAEFGKQLQSSGTMILLRNQTQLFISMLAAQNKTAGGAAGPETPAMQLDQELTEISTASLPDSIFQLPAEYQPAPAAEILRSMMQAHPGQAK